MGTYVCEESSETTAPTSPVHVAASPDHLKVLQDLQGFITALPNGGQCATQYWIRQINFQVVSQDSNGSGPVGNVPVEEQFATVSNNTCGNGQPQASGCAPTINTGTATGTFIDSITTGCGSGNGPAGCGYDIDWGWYCCGSFSRGIVKLASLNGQVRNNSVTINGRSTAWPNGTMFRP